MNVPTPEVVKNRQVIPLWAQLAGGAAALASIVSAATQTIRMIRVRTADGIAPLTWILLSISSLTWFAYGISVRSPQQIVANGSWVVLVIVLTWFMMNDRMFGARLGGQTTLAVTLALLIILGMVDENIPGWIGIPASLTLSIPQIRYTLRHGRGPGISLPAWVFLATSSYLWFTYGIGAGQVPVIVNSGMAALLGTVVVIALLVRPHPIESESPVVAVDVSDRTYA
ncbi:MAG: hypothetical protein EBS32_12770 [Actinobacteria bacterium]|nr:hypothetical protein [Actinomycetota bacterium]